MIESINGVQQINDSLKISEPGSKDKKTSKFTDLLKDNINKVNELQIKSDKITKEFALGNIDNTHQVTIATEKAKLALNMTTAIQNKVMDAYKKIMRLRV